MARPNQPTGIIHVRRRMVERLLLRGMKRREIQEALSRPPDQGGIRNPETDKPYSLGTIHKDCAQAEERWQREIDKEAKEHRARQVRELQEARRLLWQQENMSEVRLNIGLEADLLGTKQPDKHEISGKDGGAIVTTTVELTDAERRAVIEGMLGLSENPD